MTTNTMQLKKINTELIRTALKNDESATKNSLAQTTGLSVATCGNILAGMLETGEVSEISNCPSSGGRPSRQFVYNEDFYHVCGIYLRVENRDITLFAAAANISGKICRRIELHPERVTVQLIEETVEQMLNLVPSIRLVSIGIPGVVSRGVIDFCDIMELEDFDLQGHLAGLFEVDFIIENDMNCTAAGFLRREAEKAPQNLAYLYYPENGCPGCGIIINGKILYGNSNFAGEVGYIPQLSREACTDNVQSDPAVFSKLAAKTAATINCVINPDKIVIAGKVFTESLREEVEASIREIVPEKHLPELIFVTEIHESFIRGLIALALDESSCGIEVVNRRIRGKKSL